MKEHLRKTVLGYGKTVFGGFIYIFKQELLLALNSWAQMILLP